MKIGIMGGTFDPIHIGHLVAAEQAKHAMDLEEVWFLPANIPPHKQYRSTVSAKQRCDMVGLAIKDNPSFKLNTMELEREGPSYTVDTAKELHLLFPQHQFYFIIGGDMVNYLPKWYKIEEILQYMSFIGLQRAGHPWQTTDLPHYMKGKVKKVEMPQLDISSTAIRAACVEGMPFQYLVPAEVYRYIKEKGLYG